MTETKPEQNILNEEEYLEEMGKIIERDFFPHLTETRAQLHGPQITSKQPNKLSLNGYLAKNTSKENSVFFQKLQESSKKQRFKWFDSDVKHNSLMFHPTNLKLKAASSKLGIRYKNTRTVPKRNLTIVSKENASAVRSLLSTPSPKPGETETPITSWGKLEATPVFLSPNYQRPPKRSPPVL